MQKKKRLLIKVIFKKTIDTCSIIPISNVEKKWNKHSESLIFFIIWHVNEICYEYNHGAAIAHVKNICANIQTR